MPAFLFKSARSERILFHNFSIRVVGTRSPIVFFPLPSASGSSCFGHRCLSTVVRPENLNKNPTRGLHLHSGYCAGSRFSWLRERSSDNNKLDYLEDALEHAEEGQTQSPQLIVLGRVFVHEVLKNCFNRRRVGESIPLIIVIGVAKLAKI